MSFRKLRVLDRLPEHGEEDPSVAKKWQFSSQECPTDTTEDSVYRLSVNSQQHEVGRVYRGERSGKQTRQTNKQEARGCASHMQPSAERYLAHFLLSASAIT